MGYCAKCKKLLFVNLFLDEWVFSSYLTRFFFLVSFHITGACLHSWIYDYDVENEGKCGCFHGAQPVYKWFSHIVSFCVFLHQQSHNTLHLLTVYCTCIDIVIGALGSTMGQTLLYLTEEVLKKKKERKKSRKERHLLEYQPCARRWSGVRGWVLRKLGPASNKPSVWVNLSPEKAQFDKTET